MFYYLVIAPEHNPIKILVCLLCIALLFFESAFSIFLGCKVYGWIRKQDPKYCPGGVCEVQIKEPVQQYSLMQKIIFTLTVFAMFYGTFAYFTKTQDRTRLVKEIKKMMLSDEELQAIRYQKDLDKFNDDSDDF